MAAAAALLLAVPCRAQQVAPGASPPAAPDLRLQQAEVEYGNYRLRDGEVVDPLRLHYATLGTPHRNPQGRVDNAVLVLHWTGNSGASLLTPEYVRSLYAPGAPLDARRYYLIIPDDLGHGRSTKPSDGLRARFPHYGYGDLVDLQHELVTRTLGIPRLHAILGLSMGGMNAWQWAEAYPEAVDGVMPVVSLPAPIAGRNLLWRSIVIDEIRNDPAWQRGDYRSPPLGFVEGYQLLRMMIDGVAHEQESLPDLGAVRSHLAKVRASVFDADANDLLYSLEASRDYDPVPGLSKIKAKLYALNFSDDEFNPDSLNILEDRIKLVKGGRYAVQKGDRNSFGHLTMAHPSLWAEHVRVFMEELDSRN